MNARIVVTVLALGLIVVGAHLFPGLDNSSVESGIRNGFHLLVFGVFATIVFELVRQKGLVVAALAALLAATMIGGLSELVQYLSGRRPDLLDVGRDLSGAALAVAARLLWLRASRNEGIGAAIFLQRTLSVLFSILIIVPLLFWSSIIALGKSAAPVILDFDQWWNHYTFRAVNAEIVTPAARKGALELQLLKWRRSGLIVSPMKTDWSDYEFLAITGVMLRGPETNVTVRINDSERRNIWTDNFMEPVIVARESSVIRIPLFGLASAEGYPAMDLSDIQEIVIFARDERNNTTMLIEDIRLE